MYKLYALWGTPEDAEAFEQYYDSTHIPLAAALPGIRRLSAIRTADGLGENPSLHYRVAELVFDSKAALAEAQRTPEWDALVADAGLMVERFGATLGNAGGDEVEAALAADPSNP
jgi:uncharacterized protein (TIGR02118 family)